MYNHFVRCSRFIIYKIKRELKPPFLVHFIYIISHIQVVKSIFPDISFNQYLRISWALSIGKFIVISQILFNQIFRLHKVWFVLSILHSKIRIHSCFLYILDICRHNCILYRVFFYFTSISTEKAFLIFFYYK